MPDPGLPLPPQSGQPARVISIQSQVVHGHVGNSAAVFPMQASGIEVAAVPTAILSNHPRYPTMHGKVFDPELLAGLLKGVEERGLTQSAAAALSGWLGSPGNGAVVAGFVTAARAANPALVYICDPVMGDDDLGIFVPAELVTLFRDTLVPAAGFITPNQFELELLSGLPARTEADLITALGAVRGPDQGAAVTGCTLADTPEGHVETAIWWQGRLSRTAVRRLPIRPCGTGDCFTGLFTAGLCHGLDPHEAGRRATAEIFAILQETEAAGSAEMRITSHRFARPD